jgi:hypothetical protein
MLSDATWRCAQEFVVHVENRGMFPSPIHPVSRDAWSTSALPGRFLARITEFGKLGPSKQR